MAVSTRPFLVVYIVWHPGFAGGPVLAEELFNHYRRDLFDNVSGGTGLSVIYRSAPARGSTAPLPIDFTEGETTAVVLLFDQNFAADTSYMNWLRDLSAQTDVGGLATRLFPISIDGGFTSTGIVEQAIRWDHWITLSIKGRTRRLISALTYQLARMLRSYLEHLKHPADIEESLTRYLKKVQIFLSHSKRDEDNEGERIAKAIRDALYLDNGFASFFDVYDIAPGLRFNKVIPNQVRVSAVVAIHTDSFSSREWCRREIIEAKIASVPLVVANCILDSDERGFPYMGNVPIVRMDPRAIDRIDDVIGRLLDEVLKDFLWRCRVQLIPPNTGTHYLPRPPELISLVGLDRSGADILTLVYPDPPLGAEELRLFEELAPDMTLCSLTEWIAAGATA